MRTRVILSVVIAAALQSCTLVTSVSSPTGFAAITKVAVIRQPKEYQPVSVALADAVKGRGVAAVVVSSRSEAVDLKADALLVYTDKWSWDLAMYMSFLDVRFERLSDGEVLAKGHLSRFTLFAARSYKSLSALLVDTIASKAERRLESKQ